MFTKANQIPKTPKTEMIFEKETQKKCKINKKKLLCLNTYNPHVLSWVLSLYKYFVFYGSVLQNKAHCLLLSDVSLWLDSFAIPMPFFMMGDTGRVFVTEATPLALEMVQSKAQHNSHEDD